MTNIIKKITIVSGQGVRSFEVGTDRVEEIKDTSIEYENSITILYHVYDKDGKLLNSIKSCPVVVDYKLTT